MFFTKVIVFGFAVYMATMVFAGVVVGFTIDPETPEHKLIAEILLTSLFVWFGIASTLLLLVVKVNKTTFQAIVARTVFIWAPIGLGWYFTNQTGGTGWYVLGLAVSSLFLSYEVVVHLERQKNVTPKEKV